MSDLSRHRPYLIWGVAVVGLAIVFVLAVVPTGRWVAIDERRSSTRVTPDGVAAWARSLEELGVDVAPRFRSFTDEPPRGAGMVILRPVLPPSASEAHAVLEWVRAGGTLVYAPPSRGLIADSLGIELHSRTGAFGQPIESKDSLLTHPWSGGRLTGPSNSSTHLEAGSARSESWVPLSVMGDTAFTSLAWVPEGEGGVLVLADSEELANRSLDASIQAIVATRAVVDRLGPGDTLFFSEYHQALDGRRGVLRETYALTSSTPWGRAVLHLAIVGLVLLLLSGRRFGAPLPEKEGGRRSTLEHVRALAGIYRAADSHGTVARYLIRGSARRLGAPHPSGADPETEILTSWQSRPDLAKPAGAALAALHADPANLVALEDALDTIVSRHNKRSPSQ